MREIRVRVLGSEGDGERVKILDLSVKISYNV
jgi:hypothetical protein